MSRDHPDPERHSRVELAALALVCGAVAGMLYLPAIDGEFVWDDAYLIVNNTAGLDEWSDALRAFVEPGMIGSYKTYYRPLLVTSYVVDGVTSGFTPRVFHRTNVLLHAANTVLVWWMLWVLVRRRLAASFGALLFAVHPLQTQAVALITGRNDLLLLAPFVLAVIVHRAWSGARGGRRIALGLLLLGLYALVVWTKETGVVLPLLLLVDLILVQRAGSRRSAPAAGLLVGLVLVAATYFLTRWILFGSPVGAAPAEVIPWGGRLLSVVVTLGYYTRHVLLPFGFAVTPYHDGLMQPTSPEFLTAAGFCLALIAATVMAWRWRPPAAFGLLWFAVVLIPVSGLMPMVLMILEHRAYVPMAGFAIVGASLLAAVSPSRAVPSRVDLRGVLGAATAIAILVVLCLITRQRIPVYHDSMTLWSSTVAQVPRSAYARYALGFTLAGQGRHPEATEQYEQAVRLNPRHENARLELSLAYRRQNRTRDAIDQLEQLVRINPRNPEGWNGLGEIRARAADLEGARAAFERSLSLQPGNPKVLSNLGWVLDRQGKFGQAVQVYNELVALQPKLAIHWSRLAHALSEIGAEREAASARRRAEELQSGSRMDR